MAVSLADVSQAGIGILSLFAGFLKTIAPPERAIIKWTGFASVIAGLAFLSVKLLAHMSTHHGAVKFWGILACVSVVLSVVLFFIYLSALQARTVDYAGQSRIAGDEYTTKAGDYHAANPTFTREQILNDYAGDVGQVWTERSLRKATLILAAEYSLFIAGLAFGMNLGLEVLNNTWTNPPLPEKPTLEQRASALKDVHFELDKGDLEQDAIEKLSDDAAIVVNIVQQFPKVRIIVEGHCDDRGSLNRNLALGYRRARAVGDVLVHRGISAEKLQLASHGKGSPVCSDASDECRRRNRRVHLTVVE
ncbi:MAG TPA: OmpA family protein [Candidatus Sulfotelmatobacter sp.]